MTTTNLFRVQIEFGIDEAPDFIRGESLLAQFFNSGPHQILGGTNLFDSIKMTLPVEHEGAGAVAEIYDSLPIELGIGLDHCIGADHKLLRERSNAGQLVAGSKQTALDRMPETIHQLNVNRDA
jgi:hypothetical protein